MKDHLSFKTTISRKEWVWSLKRGTTVGWVDQVVHENSAIARRKFYPNTLMQATHTAVSSKCKHSPKYV